MVSGLRPLLVGAVLMGVLWFPARAHAGSDELDEKPASRPPHFLLEAGYYAALGSPAPWGPSLSLDLLPGSLAQRWGLRGEWRGYRHSGEGSTLLAAIFEAGASRPKLALKLVMEAGLTSDNDPIVGGGIEWSLWVLGPLGVSTVTDLQVIVDGRDTRPALSFNLCLHLGR